MKKFCFTSKQSPQRKPKKQKESERARTRSANDIESSAHCVNLLSNKLPIPFSMLRHKKDRTEWFIAVHLNPYFIRRLCHSCKMLIIKSDGPFFSHPYSHWIRRKNGKKVLLSYIHRFGHCSAIGFVNKSAYIEWHAIYMCKWSEAYKTLFHHVKFSRELNDKGFERSILGSL